MWLVLIIAVIVALLIFAFHSYVSKKRRDFVLEHSPAIKYLKEANEKYTFKTIVSFDMTHKYDNEHSYIDISPKDYLTYQLVYKGSAVKLAIKDARENKRLYSAYINQIKSNCKSGQFERNTEPCDDLILKIERSLKIDYILNKEHLVKTEKQLFHSLIKKPATSFDIDVLLWRTDINGQAVTSKRASFNENEIEDILTRLSHKHNGRYLDDGIWGAICRVERGRVSNKMRFEIYRRDGNRCRKCGKRGNGHNLEIDHIFPISKGGKSEYNNLQTLCRECNLKKSNTVEHGAINPRAQRQGVKLCCEWCGAPLERKNGKYGDFYGCSNYPKCRFTKQITKG